MLRVSSRFPPLRSELIYPSILVTFFWIGKVRHWMRNGWKVLSGSYFLNELNILELFVVCAMCACCSWGTKGLAFWRTLDWSLSVDCCFLSAILFSCPELYGKGHSGLRWSNSNRSQSCDGEFSAFPRG